MIEVIAISGAMGSGKSSLVRALVEAVPGAVALFEDDYQTLTSLSETALEAWWERGADVAEFDLGRLADAIRDHKWGPTLPALGPAADNRWLFLETQYGRFHPQLRPWIDVQFWSDTPADVALARKVAQHCRDRDSLGTDPADGEARLAKLAEFCDCYLGFAKRLIDHQRAQVPAVCDAVIDGRVATGALVRSVLDRLHSR